MNNREKEYIKNQFLLELKQFATEIKPYISHDGEWTIKGFIDLYKQVYSISTDTKIVSKILELHIFPLLLEFAKKHNYILELATYQNWYPDVTLISKKNKDLKFAVDLKTTYRNENHPEYVNGFTLGSHGEYFINRSSSKNIQYPYNEYLGHYCLGIIYTRKNPVNIDETRIYKLSELERIPSVISDFIFFAEEKWRIASDKGGSGNTANIGSINNIDDILNGNGVFALAGEEIFDDYWANFGKLKVRTPSGEYKKLSSLSEYLQYRGLPENLNNPKTKKRKL